MNKYVQRGLILVGSLVGVSGAMAAGPDLTAMTASIDFATVTTAVLGAGAALVLVYLAVKGVTLLIGMVRRG